jgi:hypothetical protein
MAQIAGGASVNVPSAAGLAGLVQPPPTGTTHSQGARDSASHQHSIGLWTISAGFTPSSPPDLPACTSWSPQLRLSMALMMLRDPALAVYGYPIPRLYPVTNTCSLRTTTLPQAYDQYAQPLQFPLSGAQRFPQLSSERWCPPTTLLGPSTIPNWSFWAHSGTTTWPLAASTSGSVRSNLQQITSPRFFGTGVDRSPPHHLQLRSCANSRCINDIIATSRLKTTFQAHSTRSRTMPHA